ncbi:MAG TPA: hypothetical protein VEX15_17845 [Nocardioidaceae bacterium]|nr:hypothetical protein [Nocardioidaceae bacterium]
MRRVKWLAVPMALAAMLSACGDSDDDSDSEPQSEPSVTDAGDDAFCDEAEDIVGSGQVPDQETIQKLADEAPDEISDDFQILADAMRAPQSADQAAVQEAQANTQSWGDEHCTS